MNIALAAVGLVLLAFGGYANTLPFLPVNLIVLGAGMTALAAAWAFIQKPERANPIVPVLFLALAFAPGYIQADTSTLYGEDKLRIMATLVPLTLFGAILTLSTVRRRAAIVAAIAGWGVLIVVAQLVFPDATVSDRGGVALLGSNYIAYGRAAGAGAVALIALSIYRVRFRWIYLAGGLAMLSAVAVSGSRGALAATLTAILAAFLFSRISPAFALFGILAGWIALQFVDLQSYLPERLQNFSEASTDERSSMATLTAEHAVSHPFGTGWGSLAWEIRTSGLGLDYPHNVFLELAGEAGILAAIAFVAVIILAAVRLLRGSRNPVDLTLFSLLVFFAVNASVSSDLPGNRGLWLVIGAGLAASIAGGTGRDTARRGPAGGSEETAVGGNRPPGSTATR